MPEYVGKPLVRFEDPFNVVSRVLSQLYSFWVSATYPFASVGSNLFIHPTTMLNRRLAPGIKIGNSVIFRNYAWVNTFDLSGVRGDVKIVIEDHCVINAQCVISAKNKIHLEPYVMVSACALIMDHNHAYEDIGVPIQGQGLTPGGTIRIEEGCWIGHGAAIVCSQGELVLGRNSVVAANALVTRSFPPNSVIVGNPARLARQFDPAKGIWAGGAGRPMSASELG
jgi:acetyltransferase-like isoleucine patch superfamily enzyme